MSKEAKSKDFTQFDLMFFMIVMLLLTVGLIMMFSASHPDALNRYDDSLHYIKRQGPFAVLGVIMMLGISKINYRILEKLAIPIMIVTAAFLVAVLVLPPLSPEFDYKRWFYIPGFKSFTFQPSELAKFMIVVVFSKYIVKFYNVMKTFTFGVLPFMGILGVTCGLVMLEKHLSGTIIIACIGIVLLIVGGTRFKWLALLGSVGAAAVGTYMVFSGKFEHALQRIEFYWDPWKDPNDKGWQIIQALYAIGSGGLMGQGVGHSKQKFLYVSEPQNDCIFAIVCEELGFIGAVVIIALFCLLIWRGFAIAMRAPDRFGCLLAVGLTFQVGLQAALNIMVVTKVIPNTGISLPFFSYGGSSLLMLMMQMGVILSISRQSSLQRR